MAPAVDAGSDDVRICTGFETICMEPEKVALAPSESVTPKDTA